ncbi:hypothetical protein TNCV_3678651 [Trichonephila clavipes]|nr:hypothetical protein TNCV_3678651 [Trichonephila clavipes]
MEHHSHISLSGNLADRWSSWEEPKAAWMKSPLNRSRNYYKYRNRQEFTSTNLNLQYDHNYKPMGRLNVLKVNNIKGDQTQSINQSPIKRSAICMSPVELPYVPIFLDETFRKALWDTGGSKIILDFDRKSLAIQESQVEDIKIDEGNLCVDLSETKLNVVANVLDNNTIESIIGEKVNCAIIRDLVLSSRDQLIEEQKTDP